MALQDLLGLKVNMLFEPALLWEDVKTTVEEPYDYITSVIGIIKTWADTLKLRLEYGDESWNDMLLEAVGSKDIHVFVNVGSFLQSWPCR